MGSLDFGVANELALVEARIRESIVTEEPLLHDIARYVIESGGKRIRPMVTLLAFRALGGKDVRHAHDTDVTRSEYLDIIERKTALPMSAGARVAGLLANARLEHIEAVGDYGINLGMAFQIVDDILDVVGDASRLGKPPGTDVREGNVTLVTIHALNDGSAIDVRALARLVRKHRKQDADVRRVLSLLRDSRAIENARLDAPGYGPRATKALEPT